MRRRQIRRLRFREAAFEREGAVIFLLLAALAALLCAAGFYIWRTRQRIERMAEAVETFDLGDFEGRLAKAAGGDAKLARLAAGISGLSMALFAGASSVSTTASSTIAEKEAQNRQLRELFAQRVREVLDSVGTAITEIGNTASSMRQLVGDTEKYSAHVLNALLDASNNVAGVAEGAGRLSDSIGSIGETISRTATKADCAVAQAEQANTMIQELVRAAQTIGDVITIINDIAKQSNLLALNATIEAARAGAAGRSFAVVAQEVKQLASQTVQATEDIRKQITGIQAATRVAVGAVDTIGNEIRGLSELTGDMRNAIGDQHEATRDIAAYANAARGATEDLRQQMMSVDNVIQANSLAGGCIFDDTARLHQNRSPFHGNHLPL